MSSTSQIYKFSFFLLIVRKIYWSTFLTKGVCGRYLVWITRSIFIMTPRLLHIPLVLPEIRYCYHTASRYVSLRYFFLFYRLTMVLQGTFKSQIIRDDLRKFHHRHLKTKKIGLRQLITNKARNYFRVFLETSSIHGLNHFVANRRHPLEVFSIP